MSWLNLQSIGENAFHICFTEVRFALHPFAVDKVPIKNFLLKIDSVACSLPSPTQNFWWIVTTARRGGNMLSLHSPTHQVLN